MREKFTVLIYFVIFFQYSLPVNSVTVLAPALYVFGDSLLDSGNNNLLPTFARANYLPYGENFAGGATGRFTNGRTVVDFLAEFLGLPLSPPYMRPRGSVPLTGLNYASGSCGILPETGNYIGKCLNLDEQIHMFERTVQSDLPKHYAISSEEFSQYLSKSIFVISVGSNDYINNYLQPNIYPTSKLYSPQSFAKLLISSLSQGFERLYKLGARKVIVFEIGPVGCIPSFTRQNNHKGQCVEEINQLILLFNEQLGTMLTTLTSTLRGSTFILGQANWIGYDSIINPSRYGLSDTTNPCCTTWANGTSGCIPDLPPCPNTNKYYFWDAFHPTEAVYSEIAWRCVNDNSVCIPMNIQKLLEI